MCHLKPSNILILRFSFKVVNPLNVGQKFSLRQKNALRMWISHQNYSAHFFTKGKNFDLNYKKLFFQFFLVKKMDQNNIRGVLSIIPV